MKGLSPSNKQIEQLLEQHDIFLTNLHHDQPANNHVQHITKKEEYHFFFIKISILLIKILYTENI